MAAVRGDSHSKVLKRVNLGRYTGETHPDHTHSGTRSALFYLPSAPYGTALYNLNGEKTTPLGI